MMCDDVDGVEVDFVEVTAVLDEDDGLQFQLPKHHRCACHLLNLVPRWMQPKPVQMKPTRSCPGQHLQSAMHYGISVADLRLQQRL